MTTRLRTCLLLMAVITLAACQTNKPVEQSFVIQPMDARQLGYRISWLADLAVPAGTRVENVTAQEGLLLMVEKPANAVTVLSLRDGSVQWVQRIGDQLSVLHTPIVAEGSVWVNSSDQIYRLDSTSGTLLEFADLATVVESSPTLYGALAIFGGGNGRAFAHSLQSNMTRWEYDLTARIIVTPLVIGNSAFFVDSNGIYAMLDVNSGEPLWRGRTFGKLSARPAADAATIYVPGEDSTLYALLRTDGRDRWRFHATEPLKDSPVVMGDMVIQPLRSGLLVAIDAATGKERWRTETRGKPLRMQNDQILLYETDALVLLDGATGRELRRTPTQPLAAGLVTSDNAVILLTRGGRIARLDPM